MSKYNSTRELVSKALMGKNNEFFLEMLDIIGVQTKDELGNWRNIYDVIEDVSNVLENEECEPLKKYNEGALSWNGALKEKKPDEWNPDIYLIKCPGQFFEGAPDFFKDNCNCAYDGSVSKIISCEECWEGKYIKYE